MLERRAIRKWQQSLERNYKDDKIISEVMRSVRFDGDLLSMEREWKLFTPSLQTVHGYDVRPRFHTGWKPSWFRLENALKEPQDCSDYVTAIAPDILDAKRRTDGLDVVIKRVKLSEPFNELKACRVVQAKEVARDAANHCVRLLDVIVFGPQPHQEALLVFPHLFPYDVMPFEVLGEALDFFMQMFEGLEFMHKNNVAHRDICQRNTMLYAPDMFPYGAHVAKPGFAADRPSRLAPYRSRRFVRCRYYYIDFGHATDSDFASVEDRHPVLSGRGQYNSAPEYDGTPCDGFKLDVWCLGYLVKEDFLDKYPFAVGFLQPLVEHMMQPEPSHRPTASEAFATLRGVLNALPDDAQNVTMSRPLLTKIKEPYKSSGIGLLGASRQQETWRAPLFD